MGETAPLIARIIAEEMVWSGLHTAQVQIMKPCAQRADALLDGVRVVVPKRPELGDRCSVSLPPGVKSSGQGVQGRRSRLPPLSLSTIRSAPPRPVPRDQLPE